MSAAILDDPAALSAGDPRGLLEALLSLPEQLTASFRSASTGSWTPAPEPRSVTVCAMGGSAAAGDTAASAFRREVRVPLATIRGDTLPGHCGEESLVLCVSYSGNTEETLAAYDEARTRRCGVVAVASGGELAARASSDGAPLVLVPGDSPMPRAALGYLTGAVLAVLARAGILPDPGSAVEEAARALTELAEALGARTPSAKNEAKAIAEWVGDGVPLIWGSPGPSDAAAWRWKTAFNENAKVPAFSSSLPELDHNEVVGWTRPWGERFRLVVLRDPDERPSMDRRIAATLEVVEESGIAWREVGARGSAGLTHALTLMLTGDAASVYHAIAHGVEPMQISSIERIKDRLG